MPRFLRIISGLTISFSLIGAAGASFAQTPASADAGETAGAQPRGGAVKRTIENREFGDKEKIVLLLNAHCDFPTKDDLLETSRDAEAHLLEIARDEQLLLSVRMRAVQALSYFSTPANREMLEKILAHPEDADHPLMLIQAIRAYAVIAPDAAPEAIAPFLSSDSDFIRFVAIDSLKNCPGQAALQVLSNRYQTETNRFFKMRIKQAIDGHCKSNAYCR